MKKIIWDHPDGQSREAARDVDAWEVRTAAHGDLGKVSGQKYRYRGQETAVRRNQGESFATWKELCPREHPLYACPQEQ